MLVFAADSIPEFSLHTFELSFHFMSALPHSFLVRGWLEAFVVCDLVVAFALSTLGGASAARDGRPQTLEFSFHTMPDISHPNRVKGCGVFTELATQTLAFSSQAISASAQSTRLKGWIEKSSACP